MNCPKCQNKIKYLSGISINKEHNFEKGFKCPNCNTLLVAENLAQIKIVASILIIVIALLFYGINYLSKNFIDNNSFWNVALYGIPGIALILGAPFVLYRKINLAEKEKVADQRRDEEPKLYIENTNKTQTEILVKKYSVFLLIFFVVISYNIFGGKLDFFSLIPLVPLLLWILWIKKMKGKKWSLLVGLIFAIIAGTIVILISSEIRMRQIKKEMNHRSELYNRCIIEELKSATDTNVLYSNECLDKFY